jgi:serine/threonine protein kinase
VTPLVLARNVRWCRFMNSLPNKQPPSFQEMFPAHKDEKDALNLLKRMLEIHPKKRITVEQVRCPCCELSDGIKVRWHAVCSDCSTSDCANESLPPLLTCCVSLLFLVLLAAQALQHPFLESLHSPDDEPVAPATFSFEFEHEELSRERVQVRGGGDLTLCVVVL